MLKNSAPSSSPSAKMKRLLIEKNDATVAEHGERVAVGIEGLQHVDTLVAQPSRRVARRTADTLDREPGRPAVVDRMG